MRDHELELIAGLVEGGLDDEAAAPPSARGHESGDAPRVPSRRRRMLACAILASTFAGTWLMAQAPPTQWTPITEQRLRKPADGDWMG